MRGAGQIRVCGQAPTDADLGLDLASFAEPRTLTVSRGGETLPVIPVAGAPTAVGLPLSGVPDPVSFILHTIPGDRRVDDVLQSGDPRRVALQVLGGLRLVARAADTGNP